jgi:hypothetical protein
VTRPQLSRELKEFITGQIHSVVMLEVLLLLHRDQPKPMSLSEIAGELGVEEQVANEQLSTLLSLELIGRSEGDKHSYWFQVSDHHTVQLVNELAGAYAKQRIPVLSLILTKRQDRIRLFAEAFRLIKGSD